MNAAHNRTARRLGAGVAALAVAGVFLPTGSVAAPAVNGDVDVINTETVQVYTDASGKVDTKRVYEQLTMTGDGTVELDNPIETAGLRNLDGFDGFDVVDGQQRVETTVDGVQALRTVSDFQGDLPLDVSIEYAVDGEEMDAEDVVGEDGLLEVTYTVKNITAQPQEVSYPDGKGGTVTETVDVPVPMVGSLSTVLPGSFSEVQSEQANMAGDGKGGTKMSFTMTLVPPIGSDTATFGYTAQIKDAVIPRASMSVLPVNPLASPTFKTAATSYQGGAETGETLAAGAAEIDANLLKIRDGASTLLGGLIQLRDGADELEAGLSDEAAPGAQKLAAGTSELDAGLAELFNGAGQLDAGANELDSGATQLDDGATKLDDGVAKLVDGAGRLSEGAGKLSGGTGDALTGSKKLASGLEKISGGLDQLAAAGGLPKALQGVKDLRTGVKTILDKVGDAETEGTLINGLTRLEGGSTLVKNGLIALRDGTEERPGGLKGAKFGIDQVRLGKTLDEADQTGLDWAIAEKGGLDQLKGGIEGLRAFCAANATPDPDDVPDPAMVCQGTINALSAGVSQSKADLTEAKGGLDLVSAGLGGAVAALTPTPKEPDDPNLMDGVLTIEAGLGVARTGAVSLRDDGLLLVSGGLRDLETGLTEAVGGVLQLSNGANTAETGSGDLADGLSLLDGGANELANGAGELSNGTGLLADGSGKLADGTGKLADGTGTLVDGTGKLAAGAGDASDGSNLIAAGAQELASGLGDAASGSGRLAGGLNEAAEAAPALPEGADRLSKEGMSQLIAAGEGTAQEYGKLYAIVDAGSQRAQTESMALGAPEEARGLTAYSFEIQGEDGEGGRNLARGIGAALVGGLGLGAFALRRRFI